MSDQPPMPPIEEPQSGAHLTTPTERAAPGNGDTGATAGAGPSGGSLATDTASPGSGNGGGGDRRNQPGDDELVIDPAKHKKRRRRPLPWIIIILIAAAIAIIVRVFFVQTFFVPSVSMEPTLQPGDRMLVLKTGYTIERGAILVFRHPPADTSCGGGQDDLVKRVIGLPGETIWSVGNTVYINGKPLAEPWLPKSDPIGQPIVKQTVPPDSYFMMGDNRAESCDSRVWHALPRSLVVGRVFLVIWRNGHPVFDVI